MKIKEIRAMQIFDSRGKPTIDVTIELENGVTGNCKVPSGKSTGSFEAVELRDNDKSKYNGQGVEKAVENVNNIIANELIGKNIYNQRQIDKILINLDGTENKNKLGANAILGVSIGCADAAARSLDMPLFQYIGGISGDRMPMPMMNILNGGKHSDNNINIQEFMIVPIGGKNFKDVIKMASEVYQNLKRILKEKNLSTAVGDEGGFAPDLEEDSEALNLIHEAIIKSGYTPGKDICFALDIAATEMYKEAIKNNLPEGYYFWKSKKYKTREEMINYLEELCKNYPIISIEDGLSEEDWEGWKELTDRIGNKIQLVGDDLFVTNTERLRKGIKNKVANSILIKPNQIGTLTETLDAVKLAKGNGYSTVISHRSGETEDTFISDLSVAVNSRYIKAGAIARTDRVCKYNRLLKIEEIIKGE